MGAEPTAVVTAIDRALWQVYNVEQLMREFTSDKQGAVNQALSDLSSSLKDIDSISQRLSEVQVDAPAKILAWIDEGKDPDDFIKNLFIETLDLHQGVRGKVGALLEGKDSYEAAMGSDMPEVFEALKNELAASSAGKSGQVKGAAT